MTTMCYEGLRWMRGNISEKKVLITPSERLHSSHVVPVWQPSAGIVPISNPRTRLCLCVGPCPTVWYEYSISYRFPDQGSAILLEQRRKQFLPAIEHPPMRELFGYPGTSHEKRKASYRTCIKQPLEPQPRPYQF